MNDHPRRRKADRGWRILVRENWYRDVWLLLITGLSTWAVIASLGVSHRAASKVERQQEGRQVAIAVTCGATSAIIEAGRAIIMGSTGAAGLADSEFQRNLRKLGYPPKKERDAAAKKAAAAYSESIAEAVERQSGVKGLVRKDGSLRCEVLQKVSNTN